MAMTDSEAGKVEKQIGSNDGYFLSLNVAVKNLIHKIDYRQQFRTVIIRELLQQCQFFGRQQPISVERRRRIRVVENPGSRRLLEFVKVRNTKAQLLSKIGQLFGIDNQFHFTAIAAIVVLMMR